MALSSVKALVLIGSLVAAGAAIAIPVSYTFSGTVGGNALSGHFTIDDEGAPYDGGFWTGYFGDRSPFGMVISYRGQRAVFDVVSVLIANDKEFGILGDQVADGVWFQAWNTGLDHSFSASFLDIGGGAIENELLLPDPRTFSGGFCAQAEEGCMLHFFGERIAEFTFFDWAFTRASRVIPVTEPPTLALLGLSLAGLLLLMRRRRQA